MSELVGDGGDAGEAGETPEPPVGGVGATPGGRFADYTDAQVDAALAAEDEGSGAGRAPGTQAGGQERTGQEAGREAQAEQAGQEEEATGTGEGAVRPDNGHAAPDGVPDAGLPDAVADALWAKFEARMVQQDARHEADLQSLEAKYAARLDEERAKYEADKKDLEARYEVGAVELNARVEQLERERPAEPGTEITDRYNASVQQDKNRSDPQQRWRLPSDARLALDVTVVGDALSVVAAHLATGPGQELGYIGMALSTAIAAVAVMRENREKRKSKNDH